MQHRGRGTLFFPDRREWGPVDYEIDEQPPTAMALGRIEGRLRPALGPPGPFPFWDFTEPPVTYGALRLADERWWLCVLQADGRAVNRRGGIRRAGPQPEP